MEKKQEFEPVNLTISEVFMCEGVYRIPNYQRQYAWKEEQLEALWSDLYEEFKNNTGECYFLGSIVVTGNAEKGYELIDGQQRITTLMIMMNVLKKDFMKEDKISKNKFDVDYKMLCEYISYNEEQGRLQLQTDPKYDSIFKNEITNRTSYENLTKPTKAELKQDNPEYKFINTAIYFYKQFSSLEEDELNSFVNYIFFNTNIIKIKCVNELFAIKLFQVLNDRGLDLSAADIIKTYIIAKYKAGDEHGKSVFHNNWNEIEKAGNRYGFTMDEFIAYYEYYKIETMPKRQIVEEMKKIITKTPVNELLSDLSLFNKSIEKIYETKMPEIYSLRHIPWKLYVITALATSYKVEYPNKEELFKIIRRFFYLSLISNSTLAQIKQTSFNLIKSIKAKEDVEKIKNDLEKVIIDKKMYKRVYEALNDDVYNQKFLKPLMVSLEYEKRESTNETYYELDKKIHMDHILPCGYKNNEEWNHINDEKVKTKINTLGNMALLQWDKNIRALNCGFDKKIKIYMGQNENGESLSGVTSFEFSKKVVDENRVWNESKIDDRKQYLIEAIEELLEIKEEMFERGQKK